MLAATNANESRAKNNDMHIKNKYDVKTEAFHKRETEEAGYEAREKCKGLDKGL